MADLVIVDHPLVQHRLTEMRKMETGGVAFRSAVDELTGLMLYEMTRHLPLRQAEIKTVLEPMTSPEVDLDQIVAVAILRAGLGMLRGVHQLIPEARIGFLGFERDEETLEAQAYYAKVPPPRPNQVAFLLDPMLATGGTAVAAIDKMKELGYAGVLHFAAILAAPEGVERVQEAHPEVDIYCAALDRELNDKGYILPGLGDAGDRFFGTDQGSGLE